MSLDKQQRRSNCGKDNIEKKEKKLVYRIGEQKTKGQKKSHETDHTVARSFNLNVRALNVPRICVVHL